MLWEATVTQLIEADDFFEAVDKIKEIKQDAEEVVSVCPFIEEDFIP